MIETCDNNYSVTHVSTSVTANGNDYRFLSTMDADNYVDTEPVAEWAYIADHVCEILCTGHASSVCLQPEEITAINAKVVAEDADGERAQFHFVWNPDGKVYNMQVSSNHTDLCDVLHARLKTLFN